MTKHVTRKILLIMFTAIMLAVSLPTVQAASGPKLNKAKTTMYVGKTITLKVSGASGAVKWMSKNKNIATIKKTGSKSVKVKAKKAGRTVIMAKIGKKSAKCSVTVKEPYLNVKNKTLYVKQEFQLRLTGAKICSSESSRTAVATVSKSGKITAKKEGKAVISVKASNGKVYQCMIIVKDDKKDNESSTGDLQKLGVEIYLPRKKYSYTGTAIKPNVRVYSDDLYLVRGTDYTVSYSNNINVGRAQVIVKGIGKYRGKITKGFEITKVYQGITATLENETVYVGKTGKINISGAYGNLEFTMSEEGIAEIDSNGTIIGMSTGVANIYLTASGDDNHYAEIDRYVGRLSVMNEEASAYGFEVDSWSSNDTYKANRINSRNDDGSNTYGAYFLCNADEKWLDNNISFEVEDVTPPAYVNMFADMGVSYKEPEMTMESADDYVEESQRYGFGIHEPYTEDGPGDYTKVPFSGKYIAIKAGPSVRVVKLTAKKGNHVLDYIYLCSSGKNADGEYSADGVELYRQVRQKVESQIWTDEMSNLDKLLAMADYINETTHYPRRDVTSKEYNPTFWKNWAVDDKELLYSMCNDAILNRIMDLQGGIVTCQAQDILQTAATEDLGLSYLYDYESDTIAPGEGVWSTIGSHSSNPSNPLHESLAYKSANEEKVLIDAQGMRYSHTSGKASCEEHGCREKIIPLR